MIILLPPSETKARPVDGRPLALAALSFPRLAEARATMLRAVVRTARGRDGARRLGVPASEPGLTERMASIEDEPTAPPLDVYTGVLYAELGDAAPSPDRRVLVQSALLGVVDAATDTIPAYRVSADSDVQRLGRAGSWWRSRLAPLGRALSAEAAGHASPLVVDCRSGAYRTMMPVPSTPGVPVLEVAPVQQRADGTRAVVSHDAKRYRGWVTRVLLEDRRPLPDPEALAALLREAFGGTLRVELDGSRLVIVDRAG